MDIITGQVQAGPPVCPQHREKPHSSEGEGDWWCGRCGWGGVDTDHPVRYAPGNGGWA